MFQHWEWQDNAPMLLLGTGSCQTGLMRSDAGEAAALADEGEAVAMNSFRSCGSFSFSIILLIIVQVSVFNDVLV